MTWRPGSIRCGSSQRLPVDASGLVISGTKITMAQPKLSGYTRDSRWYEVTRERRRTGHHQA